MCLFQRPYVILSWPSGFQEVKVPEFMTTAQDGGRLSALQHNFDDRQNYVVSVRSVTYRVRVLCTENV